MSWSKKYYTGLTNTQHNINDDWFKNMLRVLKDSGILFIPNLNKSFNKKGVEVYDKETNRETLSMIIEKLNNNLSFINHDSEFVEISDLLQQLEHKI